MEEIRRHGYMIKKDDMGRTILSDKDMPVRKSEFEKFKEEILQELDAVKKQLGSIRTEDIVYKEKEVSKEVK